MARLSVDGVTKVFEEKGKEPHVVLENLRFDIEEGQFISLLGPSGCGKTTLLTMMGGFQAPTSGKILLDGVPVEGPSSERGYVFQNYALFPWMTVEKNVAYGMKFSSMSAKEKQEKLKRLIEIAHLQGHEKKYPIQLSGGMQQRAAVARALAGQPKVLLLDEPLGAVDFQMRELMQNELEHMVREAKITVVMVTHDVSESVFLSDRVIVLSSNKGRVVADVPIDLPRPRDRSSEEFDKYVFKLTNLVRRAFQERTDTTF
ncbi:MAG: ABC transporter ATP-binding protein [Lachnospiraceae bacterium]|nr:ABC transporter ATP-binding protein [Candidatus Equihabitans merdae]